MGTTNVLLVLFIIVFINCHFDFAACSNSRCREIEWKALMDFKESLVDGHDRLSSWTGRDCCSWYGITCHNRTDFVQMLDLNNYNMYLEHPDTELGGQINSSLLNLEHLEYLDLSYNNFSGIQIPEFFGSLRNLQLLDLTDAKFSGEIPQHLGNLSNLQHLSLGRPYVYLSEFYLGHPYFYVSSKSHPRHPPILSSKSLNWITGLSSLRSLALYSCNLTESVDWLDSVSMLSSLSSLTLFHCGLVGMSLSHYPNLTSLVSLDLSYNNFNSPLHPAFFNLTSLEDVYLTGSSLVPIPNMFQKLTSLNSLELSGNSFGSKFPDSLCTLTRLTQLSLESSNLHNSLPSCIGNLTKLQQLDVFENSLTTELDESFFDGLKNLEHLELSGNQFVALNVPSKWIPPLQIQTLYMDSVFIGRSPFPAWLQTLTNLTVLSLRYTNISGVVPAWFQTSFPQLRDVDLSHNFLVGTIPTFNMINKATLQDLDLSNNRFIGKIPDELCNLPSMRTLSLASNKLTGRIPSCLGNLRDLLSLDLANNSLSGHIPYEVGYLNNLSLLLLNENKLIGELPSSLQNLTELVTFDVGKNNLLGFIPNWIGKKLQYLMLQSNNFSGEINQNLCQLPSLRILNLEDNNLVGTIPPCLGNLMLPIDNDGPPLASVVIITIKGIELEYSSNLMYARFISLSGNHLYGKIPDELMDLTELQSLNLSNNHLTGNIPERIGNMKHLESLDLSRNQLSGAIPQSLASIDDLGYLNMSFNNLSGRIPSGGHLDTLNNAFVYEGNSELCGEPTLKRCDDDLVSAKQSGLISDGDDDSEIELEWFYAGIGPGFAVGFLGVFCILFFKRSWRYRFFRFLENVYNRF